MRATLLVCLVCLTFFSVMAADENADAESARTVHLALPTAPSPEPCADAYSVATEPLTAGSDSLDRVATESIVSTRSPLGRILFELSCLLAST